MAQVRVNAECPCGRLLDNRMNDPKSGSTISVRKICPSCKKKVLIQYRGDSAYTSYER